jgi:cytochrome c oxidase cbb3-type subunit 1
MSVIASSTQTLANPALNRTGAGIEPSCRLPLLYLFGSGAGWLFIGLCFAFIASLKFHNPNFLTQHACFTYGRVHASQLDCVLYGFGVPSALGVSLWLLCRLGRTTLVGPGVILIGTAVWNFAVTVGVLGVLAGDASGFESFEMPRYVSWMLLTGYALIGICALLTFHQRQPGALYPAQWFVVGAIFWFPWIFTTATALLLGAPARGVLQAVIAWWYAHNFNTVFLGFAGLGSILYFVPKLLGRPLHSYYVAALGFWTLALFGSCGGIPAGAPVPAWITSLSAAGTILSALPVLAIAFNFIQTVRHDFDAMDANLPVRFAYVAFTFWLIAMAQQIVGVIPGVSDLTNYTWFGVAQWELFHYGFFAMAMFGAMYYIVPRLLDHVDLPEWAPGLAKAHFWLTFFGVLISYIALVVGGVGQGYLLNEPRYSFTQVVAATLTALRVETLGDVLIILGTLCFLLNFALMLSRHCGRYCARMGVGIGKERL